MHEQIELEDAIAEAQQSSKQIIKTDDLLNLIDKYNLNNYNDKAIFIINNDKLEIKSMDSSNTLYAHIKTNNILNIDKDFGIFNTKQFTNLIKLFDKEVSLQFNKLNDELDSILLSSNNETDNLEIQVNLADPTIFNKTSVNNGFIKEHKLPKEYEININLSSDFISKFMKIADAFADDRMFHFQIKRKKLYFVVGNENTRSNMVNILLSENEGYTNFEGKVSFLLSDFKRILKANKSAKTSIKISIAGVMIISAIEEYINSTYYIMAVN